MSILSSTCTGAFSPLSKSFLLERGYTYSQYGVTERYEFPNSIRFKFSDKTKCIEYDAVQKVWYTHIDSVSKYWDRGIELELQSVGDLLMLEKFWNVPDEETEQKTKVLLETMNFIESHYQEKQ